MTTRRPRFLGPLLAALAAGALWMCACSEDTPTEPDAPEDLLPAYYIQSGAPNQSVLVGWAHLPVSPNSGVSLLEAAYYLDGKPLESLVEILWDTGATDPHYDWRLGNEGGPWLWARIDADGERGPWSYVLHGWGELAIEEFPGETATMPLVFDPLSPLSHALLARRWDQSGAQGSTQLPIIYLADARAKPVLATGTVYDEGETEQDGFTLRTFRLEVAGERFFTKVMLEHYPIPYATWWESRQLALQFVGEELPIFVDDTPDFPQPAGYSITPLHVTAGGLELGGEMFLPEGEGPFPACLLLAGAGLADTEAEPLLRYLAHDMARIGWMVYRADKPGTGASQGELDRLDLDLRREAIAALWQALLDDENAHPDALLIAGHGEGAALALEFAAATETVAGILALAPPFYNPLDQPAIPAADQAQGDFIHFLGLDCFVGKYRNLRLFDSENYLEGVSGPVALFRGEEDEVVGAVELEIQANTIGVNHVRVRHIDGLDHNFTEGRAGFPPGEALFVEVRDWLAPFAIPSP